ncbi:hypothetical protein HHI36_004561 [Cryptolaemus montrouzieri]|uniref:Uncharacterized protein n=1 Tax=Cryptolaemus montrouzieri TaxID=559131 RepID=A0ABD2NS71_9CUCU
MFDCIVPNEVDGVAFITLGDLSSLISMVADDVDGAGMIASDDVAAIGLTEVDVEDVAADDVVLFADEITPMNRSKCVKANASEV